MRSSRHLLNETGGNSSTPRDVEIELAENGELADKDIADTKAVVAAGAMGLATAERAFVNPLFAGSKDEVQSKPKKKNQRSRSTLHLLRRMEGMTSERIYEDEAKRMESRSMAERRAMSIAGDEVRSFSLNTMI